MLEYLTNTQFAYDQLREFLAAGGPVLMAIGVVTFIMWAMIIERIMYWTTSHAGVISRAKRAWAARADRSSWYAGAVRDKLISEAKEQASQFNGLIRALVAVTPLLGLLGTVTGMVFVFDVMAVTGSSNARLMAAGITRATIPTMAGLVASLSGLVFINAFEQSVKRAIATLGDELSFDDD
ncbi:MAG: MotA/TolQ/ExbB proton channel family protein [Pseudomonadota bacterium]